MLARYGVAPGADLTSLQTAIEARGWIIVVDDEDRGPGGPLRYHATAVRTHPLGVGRDRHSLHETLRSTTPTAEEALAWVLAKVLKREGLEEP